MTAKKTQTETPVTETAEVLRSFTGMFAEQASKWTEEMEKANGRAMDEWGKLVDVQHGLAAAQLEAGKQMSAAFLGAFKQINEAFAR